MLWLVYSFGSSVIPDGAICLQLSPAYLYVGGKGNADSPLKMYEGIFSNRTVLLNLLREERFEQICF